MSSLTSGVVYGNDKKTTYQPWIIDVRQKISQKVEDVREFIVSEDNIARVIQKRMNCTAPEIDGIENFWWKTFKVYWRSLGEIMNQ